MSLWSLEHELAQPDRSLQRISSGTTSVSNVIEGQSVGKVYTKDATIIVNDGTNDRVLIGFQANGF